MNKLEEMNLETLRTYHEERRRYWLTKIRDMRQRLDYYEKRENRSDRTLCSVLQDRKDLEKRIRAAGDLLVDQCECGNDGVVQYLRFIERRPEWHCLACRVRTALFPESQLL
jgi:hypothetical protein